VLTIDGKMKLVILLLATSTIFQVQLLFLLKPFLIVLDLMISQVGEYIETIGSCLAFSDKG